MEERILENMSKMEEKFDGIYRIMAGIDQKCTMVKQEMVKVKEETGKMEKQVQVNKKSIDKVSTKIKETSRQMEERVIGAKMEVDSSVNERMKEINKNLDKRIEVEGNKLKGGIQRLQKKVDERSMGELMEVFKLHLNK